MMNRLVHAGFAAAIAVFGPAASCDGGERNQSGACPDQEVCSSETEDGLHFVGPIIGEGLFDSGGVKTLATGGTQTVSIEISHDGERSPFDLAFDAAIEGTAATIEARQTNRLVLRGGAPSSDHLRITDPVDGTLFDRIQIASQAITRIELSRTFIEAMARVPADNVILYSPGAVAYIRLRGDSGYSLVDEGMQLSGPGITQIKWDQVRLGDLAPGMHHPLTVVVGGQTAQVEIPIVAGPDRLQESWGTTELVVGEPGIICYGSFLGARYVHVPWSFTADNADVEASYLEGCVNVTARTAGSVVLHVRGGGLVLDHTRSAIRGVRSKPDPAAAVGTDGERAATVRAWTFASTM